MTQFPQYLTNSEGQRIAVIVPFESPTSALRDLLENLSDEELDELYILVLQFRAIQAVESIRNRAEAEGLDKLTLEEINKRIDAARRDAVR